MSAGHTLSHSSSLWRSGSGVEIDLIQEAVLRLHVFCNERMRILKAGEGKKAGGRGADATHLAA